MEIVTALTSFEFFIVIYAATLFVALIGTFFAARSVTANFVIHHKIAVISIGIVLIASNMAAGISLADKLTKTPQVQSVSPEQKSRLSVVHHAISITFDMPVDFSKLRVYSYPQNELTVIPYGYFRGKIPFGRSADIIFSRTFPPGEPIIVYLSNIKGPVSYGYGGEKKLTYSVRALPEVVNILSPTTSENIPVTSEFIFRLSLPTDETDIWSAVTNPPTPLVIETREDSIRILPETKFEQGTRYTLSLLRSTQILSTYDGSVIETLDPVEATTAAFTTVKPPFVESFSPNGTSADPRQPIEIRFSEPMDTSSVENALSIIPEYSQINWDNTGTILTASHKTYLANTNVTLSLRQGIRTKNGGSTETPITHEYSTAGSVRLISSNPTDSQKSASVSAKISAAFDQPVDIQSARDSFSITPPIGGTLSVSGSNIIYTPNKPLSYETSYTVRFKKGLAGPYGSPMQNDVSFTFSTQPDGVSLNVPFFMQQSSFTCNIAAARMLLAYRGVSVSEADLINKIGSGGKRYSGNPFIGYIDDYGTYWDAVTRGVHFYRNNRVIQNGTISDIVQELRNGNPVMTWGQNGWSDPHDMSWTTNDGIYIKAVNGMHSVVVRGFTGPDANPKTILLNDPFRGKYSIPVAEFIHRWSYFNTALVVD